MAKKPVIAPTVAPIAPRHSSRPSGSVQSVSKLAAHAGAANGRAHNQHGMDWVHRPVRKKKLVAVKPQPVVVEPPVAPEPPKPSVAELMAAELAGVGHVTHTPVESVAAATRVIEHHSAHHTAAASATAHRLTEEQREMLRNQFKHAVERETKHATHHQRRRHVAERVRHHARKAKSPRTVVAVFLFGVILSGLYATIDSFNINQQARQALAQQAAEAEAKTSQEPTKTADTTAEKSDTSQVPGENTSGAPTDKTVSSYNVPADLARFISIPKLGIHAPVISVGLTSTGAVGTPSNIWEAAWYNGSAKPGQDGATFIDGHSSASGGALFGHLEKLVNGDTIKIERGDGTIITYKVVKTAVVDKDQVDMRAMLTPYGGASKGLNLITCEGDWINSERTLTKRVLVWTEQV